MTTDPSTQPPAPASDGSAPAGPHGNGEPPRPGRLARAGKLLAWLIGVPVVLTVLVVGLLYGALTTERGTAWTWQAAVKLLGGKLTGQLDGGTLAAGVRLRRVEWRGSDGTDIKIDRIAGQWALSRQPWRFTVDYLHVGTIEARLAPSPSSGPTTLPQDLQLPIALDVRDVQVDQLVLHEGASTTTFSRFVFHGRSDGRHHEASVERLDTPYGAVTAHATLDGRRPFALAGDAGYSGKVNDEDVQVRAHLTGTLESLAAEVDASGLKLTGHAHVEATPFADVPLKRATVAFDHVNPQAFSPSAPFADLAVRAELQPAAGAAQGQGGEPAGVASRVGASGASATGASGGSAVSARAASRVAGASAVSGAASSVASIGGAAPATGAATAATPARKANAFAVAGSVSIINAKPGALDAKLLPLIDARSDVWLDARTQRLSNLNVRLVKNATVTGGGTLAGKRGQFDLRVAGLDLNALEAGVRPTDLSGPIGIRLNDDIQTITLDLADSKAALRAQGKVTFDPARTSFNDVRVSAGRGRIDLSGAIKHDASSTWNLKATLTDFDPLMLTSQGPSASVRGARPATTRAAAKPGRTTAKPAAPSRRIEARVNGTLAATGVLAPTFTTRAEFHLGPSVYDNLPMTGSGTVQLAGSRILPSKVNLSVAGNEVDLQGSFGARGDRLRFKVNAPQLERLGFGLAGFVSAAGDVTGTFTHPDVALDYQADGVVVGSNRIGHAQGHAEMRDGPNGMLAFTTDARDLTTAGVNLSTVTARLSGTRAKHTLEAAAVGKIQDQAVDLTLAANGRLTDASDGTHWDGTVTRLANRGTPRANLEAPLALAVAPGKVTLGATRLTLEGASLDLKSFAYDHGRIRSAGTLTGVSLARVLELRHEITGAPSPTLRTDLVFDSDWDFALAETATGHIAVKRRSGDITLEVSRGLAPLGITDIAARADFSNGNRVNTTLHAQASRIGVIDANAATTLVMRDGVLTADETSPLTGAIKANVPQLKTTGGLFGPGYLLDGHVALKLVLAGTLGKPNVSGSLLGDGLSATMVDQGVQLKDGVIHIALTENLVDFQQVEFHGASGTLRATGRVRLDSDEPDLTASIVADKLELFASPDRRLSLSGSASVANAGVAGGLAINGKFRVDHALFDMPEQSAPELGDDVVIVRPDGTTRGGKLPPVGGSNKPVGRFAPRANIDIDLGNDFRFRGVGADLGLRGTITAMSAPNLPLRAVGNVRVTEGSTYTAFGRKLAIENGFFTFNGPVANPGINILAMRRNQQVEAGVQVTGTVQSPDVRLVSEPNVPDNEKLSWLLFGHGTDQGNNLGQQSSMTTALALLGSAGGKRIAQTVGLDEVSVGRSDVGLTDPQVVLVSKAINEWLVLGYEQGLQSAANAIKATVNLTRYWSVAAYGGTFKGVDLFYTRRFDRIRW